MDAKKVKQWQKLTEELMEGVQGQLSNVLDQLDPEERLRAEKVFKEVNADGAVNDLRGKLEEMKIKLRNF